MSIKLTFYHGPMADPYEEQALRQGWTFGNWARFVENVGFGLNAAWVHGVITDSEYDRIMKRFQKKILTSGEFIEEV